MTLPTQVIALSPRIHPHHQPASSSCPSSLLLKPNASRKPLGWLAILGTAATGFISWYQLRLGPLSAFSHTILVDPFSIFFHLLIGAVVVATAPRVA